MHDPLEGVTGAGTIVTGASRSRVPITFEPVLEAAVGAVLAEAPDASLLVYGSVATGMARVPESDVDFLAFGLPGGRAEQLARRLSTRFADRCRDVGIAVGTLDGLSGDGDEAYGGRVFLRHYCVHLAGPDPDRSRSDFPADTRAARGFNGDIARLARRWREESGVADPVRLGRIIGRRTLLAVAGMVSVHDNTWTTDRIRAAERWSEIEPHLALGLGTLTDWSAGRSIATTDRLVELLDDTVDPIVATFGQRIGFWDASDPVG